MDFVAFCDIWCLKVTNVYISCRLMSPDGRKGATIVMETGDGVFLGFFTGQGIDKREKI